MKDIGPNGKRFSESRTHSRSPWIHAMRLSLLGGDAPIANAATVIDPAWR